MRQVKKTAPATRRQRLDAAVIVSTAIDLIEEHGEAGVSTRMIGKALGVEAMAIYHYFPSRDALLDAVSGAIVAAVEWPEQTGEWRGDLGRAAYAYYGIARARPQCFPLLVSRRFNRPEALPMLDHIFSILGNAGLAPQDIATAFRILGYFLGGAGLAYGATVAADTRQDFRLNDAAFLADHPVVAATMPYLTRDRLDEIFAVGLEAMLDRIERMLREAAAG
jgi:AcrR family transcriptional regulator